jgi:hypothetical protein
MGLSKHVLIAGLAITAMHSGPAGAAMGRAEAMRLYAAGGFPISADGDHPTNRFGEAAQPNILFVDMNSDGRKEAIFIDAGPCYQPDGVWFAIATPQADGAWRKILEGEGGLKSTGKAYNGWFVLDATSAGKTRHLHFDGAAYGSVDAAPAQAATAPTTAAHPAASAARGDAAIFLAADFKRVGKNWESGCNDGNTSGASYSPATIDQRKDLNGDGRDDAVISESGVFCYGNTGTAFWVVAQQPDGSWKLMTTSIGIPLFKPTRGVGGWPDIEVGGPGFCFPVTRWNGKDYDVIRYDNDGKACKPFG